MGTTEEQSLDAKVRGIDASGKEDMDEVGSLEKLLAEAKLLLEEAEMEVTRRKNKVMELEKNLTVTMKKVKEETLKQEKTPEEVEKRRAEVRRKWRILGMKVRVGVTANIVKRRKVLDANTFMEKETEAVDKEDQLDLEGRCERKKTERRRWRRGGIRVGDTQGRDLF